MEYIGSKKKLIDNIDSLLDSIDDSISEACDLFAGTGTVSRLLKSKGYNVVCNDVQYYSFVQLKAIVEFDEIPNFSNYNGLDNYIIVLNELQGKEGFFFSNYSPSGKNEYNRSFFTVENAKKIDSIRLQIESDYQNNILNLTEYYYILFLLLSSIDRFSNTAVVYEAYLKSFKNSALKDFKITKSDIGSFAGKAEAVQDNALELIKRVSGDLLYLDPPYNSRQYSRNYHILETLMKYDNPSIKGKAGVREDSFISGFSQKRKAYDELKCILDGAKFKFVLLSYSNEGIIPVTEMIPLLEKYGKLTIKEITYPRFKSHNRSIQNREVTEFLFLVKMNSNESTKY